MMIQKIEQKFIEEEFSNLPLNVREEISDWLNLDKDKWTYRLMLLQFYFLGKEANEVDIKETVDMAYGSDKYVGIIRSYKMDKWGIFSKKKDEQLAVNDFFEAGKEHARNRPREIAKQGIFMQKSGKNLNLTPYGESLCKFLYFEFLHENGIDLSILFKLFTWDVFDDDLIEDIVGTKISLKDLVNMHLLEELQVKDKKKFSKTKFLQVLIDFVLEHPYLDSSSTSELKNHFYDLIKAHLLNHLQENNTQKLIKKQKSLENIEDLVEISWIYKLGLRNYTQNEKLNEWLNISSKNKIGDLEKNTFPHCIILKSGPGAGKSIWMLQKAIQVFLSNEDLHKIGEEKSLPILFQLGNFSIEAEDRCFSLFYNGNSFFKFEKGLAIDKLDYSQLFLSILNQVFEKTKGTVWIASYLKLIINSRIILFLDGWDELDEALKSIFSQLIRYITTQHKNLIQVLISSRFIDSTLESFKESQGEINQSSGVRSNNVNLIELEPPNKSQIQEYLREVGLNIFLNENQMKDLEARIGENIMPIDLWILSLFPNLEEMPKNRAELYERWIKYEVVIEFQERLQPQINTVKSNRELDEILKTTTLIRREQDNKIFSLVQLLEGPVPSLNPKDDKTDYALMKLLPKLIYNRLKNPDYFFNFDQIILSNPIFKRFIHPYFSSELRQNFRLINPHYDNFLAALFSFNNYLKNTTFDFLGNPQIERFFREILINRRERRDFDQLHKISNDIIVLRNHYDIILPFDENKIGFPVNHNGPFVYKIKVSNFIDSFKEQVYLFFWKKMLNRNALIPRKDQITIFERIRHSLKHNYDEIIALVSNILKLQNKYIENPHNLHEVFRQIELETPFLIPILMYAFNLSETEEISLEELSRLESSPFMELPWVKLWVYREIIRRQPERIVELTKFALNHTYNYLTRFCAVNIISPLTPMIPNEAFELSFKLFQQINNRRICDVLIFHWSSHVLSKIQLDSVEKLLNDYRIEPVIRFDILYLMILHGRKIDSSIYWLDWNSVSSKKILNFIVLAHDSQLYSIEELTHWVNSLPLNSIIYIHKRILNVEDILDELNLNSVKLSKEFMAYITPLLRSWWRRNTPYKRDEITQLFDEMWSSFSEEFTFSSKKTYESNYFRLLNYFENYRTVPELEKEFIYEKACNLLNKLLSAEYEVHDNEYIKVHFGGTRLSSYFHLFSNWVVNSLEQQKIFLFYEKYHLQVPTEQMLIKIRDKFPQSEDVRQILNADVIKNPKDSIPHAFFNQKRKTHPSVQQTNIDQFDLNESYQGFLSLPIEEKYRILTQQYDLQKNEDLFNYVYNLALINTPEACKKIAGLWDSHYVDINSSASDDPSLYIWCGIPHELLETVYEYLQDPIAKIFYLVSMSIYDSYKPKELNDKHSNFATGNFIPDLLRTFNGVQILEAFRLFLQADWPLSNFEFLLYFIDFNEEIAQLMIDMVRSGKLRLSQIQDEHISHPSPIRSLKTKRVNFFQLFIERTPLLFDEILNEMLKFSDKNEKITIFNQILQIKNLNAIKIAKKLWENHEELVQEWNHLKCNEVLAKIQSTNNYYYISEILEGFDCGLYSLLLDSSQYLEFEKCLDKIELQILDKYNKGNLWNFSGSNSRRALFRLKYIRRNIRDARKKYKYKFHDFAQFVSKLNYLNSWKKKMAISERFGIFVRSEGNVNIILEKVNELRKISSLTFLDEEILKEVNDKISDYEEAKARILKGESTNGGNGSEILSNTTDSEHFFQLNLKNLIQNIEGFDFRISPQRFRQFFNELITNNAKILAIFYYLKMLLDRNRSWKLPIEELKKHYNQFKNSYLVESEPLNPKIYEYYDLVFGEIQREKSERDEEESEDDSSYLYTDDFDKKNKIQEAKETIIDKITCIQQNVISVFKDFEELGDSTEFRLILYLFFSSNPIDSWFETDDLKSLYARVIPAVRENIQPYLLYIILRQRELCESRLSLDYVDDETDNGILLDNLFEEVLRDSLRGGYFSQAINCLKKMGRCDWYKLVRNYVLLQADPEAKEIQGVSYGKNLKINHYPLDANIIQTFSENEVLWARYLFYSKIYFHLLKAQLISIPQLCNHFKFIPKRSRV